MSRMVFPENLREILRIGKKLVRTLVYAVLASAENLSEVIWSASREACRASRYRDSAGGARPKIGEGGSPEGHQRVGTDFARAR